MITTHNVDPGVSFHPSSRGIPIFLPTATAALFTLAYPESALPVGISIPLAGNTSAGPCGYIPGSPTCVAITIGTAVHGTTYRILGINQFNKQVTEDISPTAIGVTYTMNAYKQIISIIVLSGPAAGTSTAAFGIAYGAGNKIALPFRPINKLQVAGTLQSWQDKVEVVGVVLAGGTTFLGVTPIGGAINERFATVQTNPLAAGMAWLITNYINKGYREK